MAIALDRASQAFATRKYQFAPTGNILQRYPLSSTVLIVSILTFILGLQVPAIQKYPEAWTITTGPF